VHAVGLTELANAAKFTGLMICVTSAREKSRSITMGLSPGLSSVTAKDAATVPRRYYRYLLERSNTGRSHRPMRTSVATRRLNQRHFPNSPVVMTALAVMCVPDAPIG
jgi:hypothetical protein